MLRRFQSCFIWFSIHYGDVNTTDPSQRNELLLFFSDFWLYMFVFKCKIKYLSFINQHILYIILKKIPCTFVSTQHKVGS